MAPRKKKASIENSQFYIQYGIDIAKRRVFLDEEVDETSMGWLIRAIQLMIEHDADSHIEIYINSYGGSVYDGLALYDLLESITTPIKTFCVGSAMSMGMILFLAGDERFAFPRSTFMAHSLSGGTWGKQIDMETDVKESKRLNDILSQILADRTKKTLAWWKKKIEHLDCYINFKEAKKLGIIIKEMGEE